MPYSDVFRRRYTTYFTLGCRNARVGHRKLLATLKYPDLSKADAPVRILSILSGNLTPLSRRRCPAPQRIRHPVDS